MLQPVEHTNREHASTSLKVILLVFAIVLVATLGYLVWENKAASDNTDVSEESTSSKSVLEEKTFGSAKIETSSENKTITFSDYEFSLTYPGDWIIDDEQNLHQSVRLDLVDKDKQPKNVNIYEPSLTLHIYSGTGSASEAGALLFESGLGMSIEKLGDDLEEDLRGYMSTTKTEEGDIAQYVLDHNAHFKPYWVKMTADIDDEEAMAVIHSFKFVDSDPVPSQ